MTSKITIAILDYSVGNTGSLSHVFRSLGCRTVITRDRKILSESDLLVLPGVGSFQPARKLIASHDLDSLILDRHLSNYPMLGICLGMQLLTSGSYEYNYTDGLGVFTGICNSFSSNQSHIGWNTLACPHESNNFTLYNSGTYFFNHSFKLEESSSKQVLATAHFSGETFPSILKSGNTYGIQFHPEKSQSQGFKLLEHLLIDLF